MVTHHPSVTVWDPFAFPQAEEKHCREECISYYPGKVVNIRARMSRIKLVMQNKEGQYGESARTLMYEGHMLIYNPHTNISQWVPMRGISLLLTSVELRLANDLNNICPYLHNGQGLMELHSPKLVHSIPAGEELDTDSWVEPLEPEEWAEHSNWSCYPAPPMEEGGLMWEEVTAEAPQRKIITDKEAPTWDEVTNDPLQRKVISDKEDSD